MKLTEIDSPFQPTQTHPYMATFIVDPVDAARFLRLSEDQSDVCLLGIDRTKPDQWTIYAACASREGRDLLESNW